MATHWGPQRQSRPARPSPHWARLRPTAITAAMLLTAVLAGAVGTGQAMAGTGPPVPPASAHGDRAAALLPAAGDPILGNDVSSREGTVDWSQVVADGGQFAYVKASEGSFYTNPDFTQQYSGAHDAGMFRGAYAFAIPSMSSGAAQADYFVSNGGGWSAGTRTLPGALDIEDNPHGAKCYGLSQSAMISWISDFLNDYQARTGRWPIIYTTTGWWSACTGNYGGFAANDPLWIANAHNAGTLPAGWSNYTFWQYADSGTLPGDQDVFNGPSSLLLALANGS